MQRSIMGRLADAGLRLRAGTQTQHHVPEIGLQRPKESPATGVPSGASHVDQADAAGPCRGPCGAADWRGSPNVRLP
jgi:hypothetical protein